MNVGWRDDNQRSRLVIFQLGERFLKAGDVIAAFFEQGVERQGAVGSRAIRRAISGKFVFLGRAVVGEKGEVERNEDDEQTADQQDSSCVSFHSPFRVPGSWVRGSGFRVPGSWLKRNRSVTTRNPEPRTRNRLVTSH